MRSVVQQLLWMVFSRKTTQKIAGLAVLGVAAVALANALVVLRTRGRCHSRVEETPSRDVALVLGANPNSYFFRNRLAAAAELYDSHKVHHILVSGDNGSKTYDEVTRMKEILVGHGIPAEAITCDYAGFRTLDSVIRARAIFGVTRLTIVTQRFHLYRALYLADYLGVDAIGYVAPDAPPAYRLHSELREIAARSAALVDLHVTARRPRYFGKFEPIQLSMKDD